MTDASGDARARSHSLHVVLTVIRSPRLRRIQLAFAAFNVMEWATWIAITVYAFDRGGAAEAGLAALVQLAPSAVVAPVASVLADRYPRALVLRLGYLAQGLAAVGVAVALGVAATAPLVYLLGTVAASAITLTRPVQAALLPELADTAEELTASNVAASSIENAGVFVGPAAAAILLSVSGPAAVFAVGGAAMIGAAALLPDPPAEERDPRFIGLGRAVRREVLGGIDALARNAPARDVVSLLAVSYLVLGALDVFYVVLAVEVLRLDDAAVGVLNASLGVGGLVGAAVAIGLVGRRRVSGWLVAGALAFGVGVGAAGTVGEPGPFAPVLAVGLVLLALLAAGAGRSLADVAAWTLLQRATPSHVLGRVFGILEGMNAAGQGVGAALAAVLVTALGPGGAMVTAGLALPIAAGLRWRALRRYEELRTVDEEIVARLRTVPMFAALTPPVLERLASDATPITVASGGLVIREGEIGDRYYVIADGTLEASIDGRPVRRLGPGDGVGEIALLRDTPRTATVVAVTDARVLAIDRAPFLEALAGRVPSRAVAERIVEERLAVEPGGVRQA